MEGRGGVPTGGGRLSVETYTTKSGPGVFRWIHLVVTDQSLSLSTGCSLLLVP